MLDIIKRSVNHFWCRSNTGNKLQDCQSNKIPRKNGHSSRKNGSLSSRVLHVRLEVKERFIHELRIIISFFVFTGYHSIIIVSGSKCNTQVNWNTRLYTWWKYWAELAKIHTPEQMENCCVEGNTWQTLLFHTIHNNFDLVTSEIFRLLHFGDSNVNLFYLVFYLRRPKVILFWNFITWMDLETQIEWLHLKKILKTGLIVA